MARTEPPTAGIDDRPGWRVMWDAFTQWRRTRPFWGALILLLGAWFVINPVIASLEFVAGMGVSGIATWILGAGMATAALVALLHPPQRHFPAIMAAIFSVASLPLANLGGWLVGMLCGIVGASMIFGWAPYTDEDLPVLAAKDERARLRRESRRERATARLAAKRPRPVPGDDAPGPAAGAADR